MPTLKITPQIISLCLVLSDGDIDMTMDDVCNRMNSFMKKTRRIYGVDYDDFTSQFLFLYFDIKDTVPLAGGHEDVLTKNTLRAFIPGILAFDEVYCNDEGEHWATYGEMSPEEYGRHYDSYIGELSGISKEEFLGAMQMKETMRAFFLGEGRDGIGRAEVKALMEQHGMTGELLYEHTEPTGLEFENFEREQARDFGPKDPEAPSFLRRR